MVLLCMAVDAPVSEEEKQTCCCHTWKVSTQMSSAVLEMVS